MVQNLYLYTAMRESRNQLRIIQKEMSEFDFSLKKDNKKHSTYTFCVGLMDIGVGIEPRTLNLLGI